MPCDPPRKQNIFNAGSGTDVVHNQAALLRFGPHVSDNTDVVNSAAQIPGNNIAREIVVAIIGYRYRLALPSEISHEIRYSSMVDITIGTLESPTRWVTGKRPNHVFMDCFL